MKYTIKDLSEGRCALKNGGTVEELQLVLDRAFPEDKSYVSYYNTFLHGGTPVGFQRSYSDSKEWAYLGKDEKGVLPIQSCSVFLEEINGTVSSEELMREFSTGATRNLADNKLDFEGFLSPLALEEFAKYMHKNRVQEDGKLRDSDNWQKGIPIDAYMKSMYRHFFDTWKTHRGLETPEDQISNLCGLMFNVQGMLHELLKIK